MHFNALSKFKYSINIKRNKFFINKRYRITLIYLLNIDLNLFILYYIIKRLLKKNRNNCTDKKNEQYYAYPSS